MTQRSEAQPIDHNIEPVVPGDIGYVHAPEDGMYTGPAVIPAPEAVEDQTPMYMGPAVPAANPRMVIKVRQTADGGYEFPRLTQAAGHRAEQPAETVEAPEATAEPVEEVVTPEAGPLMERPLKVMYDKDATNKRQTAVVYDAEHHNGLTVNLSDSKNSRREAVVTTASGARFWVVPMEIEGKNLQVAYNLEKSKVEGRQIAYAVDLDAGQYLSPITPGKGWNVLTETTDPVVEVAIRMQKFNASHIKNSKRDEAGEDPFLQVQAELNAIPFETNTEQHETAAEAGVVAAEAHDQDTAVTDAVEAEPATAEMDAVEAEQTPGFRERMRTKMAAAAAQLKLLARNPVYGSAALAMNTLSAVTNRENYTRRRVITGGIIGGLAVATAAVLEMKGVSVFGHVAEHKHGPSNHDMSNALIPAPKHNHHDVANALTPSHGKAHHAAEAKHHLSHAHGGSHAHEVASHHSAHAPKTVTMHNTVWETAQKEMGLGHAKHLTPAQQHAIWEHTSRILHMNNLSWDDARHLAKGTKLKV